MKTRGRLALLSTAVLAFSCSAGRARAQLDAADSALRADNPTSALEHWAQALELMRHDSSGPATLLRARALRGAADTYYLRLQDYTNAARTYRELIRVAPEAPETLQGRLRLGELLHRRFNDIRGAIAEYSAALARNPPDGAAVAYRVATLYFELGEYAQCEHELDGLLEKYQSSDEVPRALLLKGQAQGAQPARRDDAVVTFETLMRQFPGSDLVAHAQFERGRIWAEEGAYAKAIDSWRVALATHPQPSIVRTFIARAERRLKATTPQSIGDAAEAFDWQLAPRARTSVEAAGGAPEEAAREAAMPPEHAPVPPPATP